MTPTKIPVSAAPAYQPRVKVHILLLGLVLVGFNSYWVLMGTEVWHSTQLTIASLFFNAVFTLFILVRTYAIAGRKAYR